MSSSLSRRKLVTAGLTAVGGAAGLAAAARLAGRYGLIPPDWGGVYGPGETLTYACQRILTSRHSMAREFTHSEISKVAPISGYWPGYSRTGASRLTGWLRGRRLSRSRS